MTKEQKFIEYKKPKEGEIWVAKKGYLHPLLDETGQPFNPTGKNLRYLDRPETPYLVWAHRPDNAVSICEGETVLILNSKAAFDRDIYPEDPNNIWVLHREAVCSVWHDHFVRIVL